MSGASQISVEYIHVPHTPTLDTEMLSDFWLMRKKSVFLVVARVLMQKQSKGGSAGGGNFTLRSRIRACIWDSFQRVKVDKLAREKTHNKSN